MYWFSYVLLEPKATDASNPVPMVQYETLEEFTAGKAMNTYGGEGTQ
jgi:hypothetical protein